MTSELTELSIVIGDVYEAAINSALWPRALGRICAFVGGASAILLWHDTTTQQPQTHYSFNAGPHVTKFHFERYRPMDPAFPAADSKEVGAVSTTGDFMSKDEFPKTLLYTERTEPQGIVDTLSFSVEKDTTRTAVIDIHFDGARGAVGDQARYRLSLLVPHLQRTLSIGRLLDRNNAGTLDSPPRLATLAKDHKLTASETRVLEAVLRANTVRAIADILDLSPATVKTHLHNVFKKTGTTRRSDLVKLLAGI